MTFQLCLKSKIIKLSPSLCLLRVLEVSPKIDKKTTINAFSKSDYQYVLPSDRNSYTFFSYFTVYISYDDFKNNASITYELLPKYIN